MHLPPSLFLPPPPPPLLLLLLPVVVVVVVSASYCFGGKKIASSSWLPFLDHGERRYLYRGVRCRVRVATMTRLPSPLLLRPCEE